MDQAPETFGSLPSDRSCTLEYRVPSAMEQIRRTLAIPVKKTESRLVRHLTVEEIQAILDAPDPGGWSGIRDRAMLHLCYAGALRVSELIGLRLDDLRLQPQANVLVHGKGRKARLDWHPARPLPWLRKDLHSASRVLSSLHPLQLASSRSGGPHRLPHRSPIAPQAEPAVDAVGAENPAAVHYKLITIGPESSPYAVASGINNAGLVTGYYEDTNSVSHGFVWEDGEFKAVDYPGAAFTILGGVNNRGVAIGFYNDGSADHVVTYAVRSGAWGKLPDIPGYPLNQGYGINDARVAVGNAFSSTAAVAWVWDPVKRAYSYLAVPGAAEYSTSPSGLNNLNQVAGYFADADGNYHGFIEKGGNYTIYNAPGATETYPDGINDWGVLQGQWDDANYNAHGFLATTTGYFQSVDYPGSAATAIVGINDKLANCGGYSQNSDFAPTMAFVAVPE